MVALCSHLRPAPYPYGLISLRLLGKLGGNNRNFLREPITFDVVNEDGNDNPVFNILCSWNESKYMTNNDSNSHDDSDSRDPFEKNSSNLKASVENSSEKEKTFLLPMDKAIAAASETLKRVATSPSLMASERSIVTNTEEEFYDRYTNLIIGQTSSQQEECKSESIICPKTCEEAISVRAELVDLTTYSIHVMEETKKHQSMAALSLLRGSLIGLMDHEKFDDIDITIPKKAIAKEFSVDSKQSQETEKHVTHDNMHKEPEKSLKKKNTLIKKIFCGLMYAILNDELKSESTMLLRGLSTQIILTFMSHIGDIQRIDASGNIISDDSKESMRAHNAKRTIVSDSGRLQPLGPFGKFSFSGELKCKINPLLFNDAIIDFLKENEKCHSHVIDIIFHMVETSLKCKAEIEGKNAIGGKDAMQGIEFCFEHLLSSLCQCCFSLQWNLRFGFYKAIYALCYSMGPEWARLYEIEIIHTILFCLNNSPREVACASIESLLLLFRILALCHGSPKAWKTDSSIVYDLHYDNGNLSVDQYVDEEKKTTVEVTSSILSLEKYNSSFKTVSNETTNPPDAVLQMLVSELVSPNHVVRFAVRHSLRQISTTMSEQKICHMEEVLGGCSALIKKLLLTRAVRTLPLPEQVAVVDALAFIVQEAPSLIPLSDQRLLETVSELLKMAAVADGVIVEKKVDPVSKGIYIDRNGHAVAMNRDIEILDNNKMRSGPVTHASSIFLRKEFILDENATGGVGKICVPPEIPLGVQLRLSSLLLFRAIIKRHNDAFFDAASSTPIGKVIARRTWRYSFVFSKSRPIAKLDVFVRKYSATCHSTIVQVTDIAST